MKKIRWLLVWPYSRRLRDLIDTNKMKAPSFLMVLTAVGDYAYRRTDGVLVVPIGCLKN